MENNKLSASADKTVEGAQTAVSEVDYASEFEKLLQENAALQEDKKKALVERDNYKTGLLKAKGKLPDEEDDLDALIDRKVEEKLYAKREADIQARKDEIVKQALAKNKELALALKNPKDSSGVTMSTETAATSDKFLAPEQIKVLKDRGWDDKKIEIFKKNLRKRM